MYFIIHRLAKTGVHWLEWSKWSNCSESCGSGIHVRTRLCSNTTIDGSSEPCSSLGGDSFEIESCQNTECNRMHRKYFIFQIFLRSFCFSLETDVIMSCTFDIPGEKCPLKDLNNWQIQNGVQVSQIRPINDHTRGGNRKFSFAIMIYSFE